MTSPHPNSRFKMLNRPRISDFGISTYSSSRELDGDEVYEKDEYEEGTTISIHSKIVYF